MYPAESHVKTKQPTPISQSLSTTALRNVPSAQHLCPLATGNRIATSLNRESWTAAANAYSASPATHLEMSEHLLNTPHIDPSRISQAEGLRQLSRSPHPYHRHGNSLSVHTSGATGGVFLSPLRSGHNTDDESVGSIEASSLGAHMHSLSTGSDSGTEADDEHFLKGLPASRLRPHKGSRLSDGTASGAASPLLVSRGWASRTNSSDSRSLEGREETNVKATLDKVRRVEVLRRTTEVALLGAIGGVVVSNERVWPVILAWRRGKHIDLRGEVRILTQPQRLYPKFWSWFS